MPLIEYFYSAHSAFAYLGSRRLYEICAAYGVELVHKPFDLSPVVEAQGGLPFRARTQAHVDYFFGREIERWAELRDVPVVPYRPTHHDADYAAANGMIAAVGASGPKVDALAHAVLQAHWRDDADLSDQSVLESIADAQGHHGRALLHQATSTAIKNLLARNTAEAMDKGVFGSPTYVVDGEPFYGQDRLELVERALRAPFKPTRWRNPPVD